MFSYVIYCKLLKKIAPILLMHFMVEELHISYQKVTDILPEI